MNPLVSVGNPPRPFRLFRMAERSTPDPSSSRVPVHSALVQKSVTTSTNLAGQLFVFDARKEFADAQEENPNNWQEVCNGSAIPDERQVTNGRRGPKGNL